MRISAKSRYGLSSMIYMAQNNKAKDFITILTLSEKLDISRIYLEQVFSLLKRSDLVVSAKGSQGGYHLAKEPKDISVYEIFLATESALFEKTTSSTTKSENLIEKTVHAMVFDKLDIHVKEFLSKITLSDLLTELESQSSQEGYMYHL